MPIYDEKYSENVPVYRIIDQFIIDETPIDIILDFLDNYSGNSDVYDSIFTNSYHIPELLRYPYMTRFNSKQLLRFLDMAKFKPVQLIYFYWQFLAINDLRFKDINNEILTRLHKLQTEYPNIKYPAIVSRHFDARIVNKIRSGIFDFDFIKTADIKHSIITNSVFANYILNIDLFANFNPASDISTVELLKQILKIAIKEPYKSEFINTIIFRFLMHMIDSPYVNVIYKAYILENFKNNRYSRELTENFGLNPACLNMFKECKHYEELIFNSTIMWLDIYTPEFIVYVLMKKRKWFNKWYKEYSEKIDRVIDLHMFFDEKDI